MQENTVFSTLNAINCNEHTERKGSLTYLSWAWAWQMVKTHFPDATYTIYENPEGWNYFTDGSDKGIIVSDHLYEDIISVAGDLFLLRDGYTFPIRDNEDLSRLGYRRSGKLSL